MAKKEGAPLGEAPSKKADARAAANHQKNRSKLIACPAEGSGYECSRTLWAEL